MKESRERVTRADVARMAQVSETIVSYVINNNRYVAKDKRQRVEEAIRRLNYRPNNIARALKGKRSNQILFIADNITNEYLRIQVRISDFPVRQPEYAGVRGSGHQPSVRWDYLKLRYISGGVRG